MQIGIIGTGNVATANYLPPLAARDDVELIYYSRTATKATAAAARFGGRTVDSIAAMVGADPDAILVLTGERQRAEVLAQLLPLGPKRVFCEKPLVAANGQADVTEDDFHTAKALIELAREHDVELAMVFNYRFFRQIARARKLRDERDFGALRQVTATVHYACWSHAIDLILDAAGPLSEVSALAGEATYEGAGMTARDVMAGLRFESGATGTILGSAGMGFDFDLFEILLVYERGRLRLRDLDGDLEVMDAAAGTQELLRLPPDLNRWGQYTASFAASVNAYLTTVAAGTPPPVPGLAGLRELQAEAAMRRSVRERRPVQVTTEFPID